MSLDRVILTCDDRSICNCLFCSVNLSISIDIMNNLVISSSSLLSSTLVLSSILSRDRLIKQTVGPSDVLYLTLCNLPKVGDKLMDLLTE